MLSQQGSYTSRKQVLVMKTPYTPLLYSKTGVFRGIHFFLIFAPKHRSWVLVRTASLRRFSRVPTIYVLSKSKKNITIFHLKIIIFTLVKYCCILHGRVCAMILLRFLLVMWYTQPYLWLHSSGERSSLSRL